MSLTSGQLATLAAEISGPAYAGLSYEDIAAALNARELVEQPNPAPQASVPNLPDITELVTTLAALDLVGVKTAIRDNAAIATRLADDLALARAGDWSGLQAQRAMAALYLAPAALDALDALMARTQPDPAWSPTVTIAQPSRAEQLGLPTVTPEDVQEAHHAD